MLSRLREWNRRRQALSQFGSWLVHGRFGYVRRFFVLRRSFDGGAYLALNRDVAAAGLHPLLHYIEHGARENRNLVPPPKGPDNLASPPSPRRLAAARALEEAIVHAGSEEVPDLLAELSLEDWGELLLDIPTECPNLTARFPSMPPDHVQDAWTGSHGETLLAESARFTKWLVTEYEQVSGRAIRDAKVLDFGCGWGRLMRLLYKYVDAERLYGVDPWDESIRICREHRVRGHLAISEWLPKTLPFSGPFDLVFAFSVFTHLSEKTTRVALETLRRHVAADGALAITTRPWSYWQYSGQEGMIAEHQRNGFAFAPHERAPIDGDVTYGDTSMTVGYLAREFPFWRIARERRSEDDPYQTFVLLLPA